MVCESRPPDLGGTEVVVDTVGGHNQWLGEVLDCKAGRGSGPEAAQVVGVAGSRDQEEVAGQLDLDHMHLDLESPVL